MTSNHHTPLQTVTKSELTGALFNTPYGELDSVITDLLAGTEAFTQLLMNDGGEIIIASGAVSLTDLYHNLEAQSGGGGADDLDTANGLIIGKWALVRAKAGNTIAITHNVGNIVTVTGSSITLDDTTKLALLFHNGTDVVAMLLGSEGAGIADSGARVTHSTTQSTTSGAWPAAIFDTEDYDTDAYHDTVTNNSRFTIPAGLDGKFLIGGVVAFANNTTGTRGARIVENGGAGGTHLEVLQDATQGSLITAIAFSTIKDLVATDYVEMDIFQDSGGALDTDNTYLNFWIQRLNA